MDGMDSFGVALADYHHQWSAGERAIFEQAVEIMASSAEGCHQQRQPHKMNLPTTLLITLGEHLLQMSTEDWRGDYERNNLGMAAHWLQKIGNATPVTEHVCRGKKCYECSGSTEVDPACHCNDALRLDNEMLRRKKAQAENEAVLNNLKASMLEQDINTIRSIITNGGTTAEVLAFLDTPNA
jgi:hypothetical protein